MHCLRKLAVLSVLASLLLLVACNTAPEDPQEPLEPDPIEYPSHEPFVPEYGPEDFRDFPGNYYPEAAPVVDYHEDIEDLFTQYFEIMIAQDPQLIDSRRFPPAVTPRQGDRLTPVSFGYNAWKIELAKNTLAALGQYSEADLTEEERVNKAILEWALKSQVDGERFLYHDVLNLDHILGLTVFLQLNHPMGTEADAENYLARLQQLPIVLCQLETNLKIQEEIGYLPPRAVLEVASKRVNAYGDMLLEDFSAKVAGLEGQEDLVARCRQIVTDDVKPAFRKLGVLIQGVRAKAVNNVSELPGGRDYYAYLLRENISLDMTPVEVHKVCLAEVARLQEEMRRVMADLGYEGDDYIQVVHQISAKAIPQAQVLECYQELIDMAEELLPQLFGRLPQTPVAIQFSNLRTGYEIPTRDGALPGIFLTNPDAHHPEAGAKWFVWHETIPGHHLQLALEYEAGTPYFRDLLFLTGYLEGWGTYGEMLFFEYDLVDDAESYLVSLNRYLTLAARVVIDTGINYVGWSEAEAGQYFREVTGQDPKAWIEDVLTRPGRSAAYYMGMYKIRQLRELAIEELGPAFDLREFHDLVLKHGSMPMAVLEALVQDYIAEKR